MSENVETTKKQNWFMKHKVLTALGVVFLLGAAASGANGDGNSAPTDKSNSSTVQSEESAEETSKTEESNVPAEYKSALNKATSYANTMHMSKTGVYDQLTSEYGEKFTAEAAQYAIDNVKADWKANALVKAKTYQNTMSMSSAAIRDQLTSPYGEKFTAEEADYAVANLNN